jgi:hypothetical protein
MNTRTKLKNILLNTTVITVMSVMLITLVGCGAGDGSGANTAASTANITVKTLGCDSQIVAIMSTMSTPFLGGLGEPDTTTYSTTGQNHILIYEFTLARERITFEYNPNYCSQRVEIGI